MSTAISIQIPLSQPGEALALFGTHDRHLRRLREQLRVNLVLRDDTLQIEGEADAVERAAQALSEMRRLLQASGELSDEAVTDVLQGTFRPAEELPPAGVSGESPAPGPSAIIRMGTGDIDLFAKAKRIRPRTAGQERYVQAIRNSDLVFCSSPAG